MTKSAFDIITFNCYGTLIDWESGIISAFQSEAARDALWFNADDILAAYMAEEPIAESGRYRSYRGILTQTAQQVASRLGWQIKPDRIDFLVESLPNWRPFPETNPALERLARRFRLGILSNIDDELLARTRRHFTVTFDLIVTAEQVKSYKPAPAHFREALARAGRLRLLHAAQSYFHDIVPACAFNIPVVWINRKGEPIPAGGVQPTHEVRTLTELADYLGA